MTLLATRAVLSRSATLVAAVLVAHAIATAGPAAAEGAPEMIRPVTVVATVDWAAANTATDDALSDPAKTFTKFNAALAPFFPGIAQSSVPVLLPLDVKALLRERAASGEKNSEPATAEKPAPSTATATMDGSADKWLGQFRQTAFFQAGPAGYDATFTIEPDKVVDLGGSYSSPIEVAIAGAAFTYTLGDPNINELAGEPADKDILAAYPGMRRVLREAHIRYAFEKFGVPYVVSVECFDARPRPKRVSCKDADKVIALFLKQLQVAGGTPSPAPQPAIDLKRPQTVSHSFTYFAPGDLISNSGWRDKGGRADRTVYAPIRFPIADTPAFAKSQSFNPWGDCYHKGVVGRMRKGSEYHCKVNERRLIFDESAPENFTYPWRDNFCETRDSQVGQCPGGYGHQGQDIRGSYCLLSNEGADRCEPYQHDVVAARDGMIWRRRGNLAAYLSINTANDRVRFRYMHMNPAYMDKDGLVSGRRVRQGEVIGKLGNYGDYERGTSYHLHFDAQVFTRDGWVWVNPYMTLVASYERLIGARGTEVNSEGPIRKAEEAGPVIAARPASEGPPLFSTAAPVEEPTGSVVAKPPEKRKARGRRHRRHR